MFRLKIAYLTKVFCSRKLGFVGRFGVQRESAPLMKIWTMKNNMKFFECWRGDQYIVIQFVECGTKF